MPHARRTLLCGMGFIELYNSKVVEQRDRIASDLPEHLS